MHDDTPLPTEFANLGFGPENDQGRFWNKDATLGLARNEDGSWSLLDTDGCPSNHTLSTNYAIHILSKLRGQGYPSSEWGHRWDIYASCL